MVVSFKVPCNKLWSIKITIMYQFPYSSVGEFKVNDWSWNYAFSLTKYKNIRRNDNIQRQSKSDTNYEPYTSRKDWVLVDWFSIA